MILEELRVPGAKLRRESRTLVEGVNLDSRRVKPGDLFFALQGEKVDGREFIPEAISRGAAAIAVEDEVPTDRLPVLTVPNLRNHLGFISAQILGEPSRKLRVIGVTGTNGKTTTCHLLETILQQKGSSVGYIGTLGYRWGGKSFGTGRTTPEAPDLQRMLRLMVEDGVTDVVIECSSHGLELGRLNAVHFDVVVFLNLTEDHLDFHQTMELYQEAKGKLLNPGLTTSEKPNRSAILNIDDPAGAAWAREGAFPTVAFSHKPSIKADLYPVRVEERANGIHAEIRFHREIFEIDSPLVGSFNLQNVLAAVGAAKAISVSTSEIVKGLAQQRQVPGRLESIPAHSGVNVFVDYAHTKDALERVLTSLKSFCSGRLIVVFGCGGDRDREKRPRMGSVASRLADLTIVTTDNPRSEDPQAIMNEIVSGVADRSRVQTVVPKENPVSGSVCTVLDRAIAIETALDWSQPGDTVVIAGKGHERDQEIKGEYLPFDDTEVVRQWAKRRNR